MVGLVLAPDSSEAHAFREYAASQGQHVEATSGIVTLAPRQVALNILRRDVPALLDWLESGPELLPLLAATKDGVRLGSVRLEG